MPAKKKQSDPSAPAVLRRYRAAGEARELGIASVPHGGIVVEMLDDGKYRIAPDQEAPLFERSEPSSEPEPTPAEPEPEADLPAQSEAAPAEAE